MIDYDIIIIGGGISGLNCACNLIKKFNKIIIVEQNDYIGGRVKTIYNKKNKIFEAGAGRFCYNNKRLVKLMKDINQHSIVKIDKQKDYLNNDKCNDQSILFSKMIKKLEKLDRDELINNNLKTLCYKYFSDNFVKCIMNQYEKYTMFIDLNANDGIRYFKYNYNESNNFYVHKHGLSNIVNHLKNFFLKNGGKILLNHSLLDMSEAGNIFTIKLDNQKIIESKYLILTGGKKMLNNLSYLSPIKKEINSINLSSLFRLYVKYPLQNKKVWFHNLKKTVTKSKLQYLIPINYETGIIMIYTQGKYADYWLKKQIEGSLEENLKKEIYTLFNIITPNPKKIYPYYWYNGVSKWKVGIDSNVISKKMLNPFKNNLYICGECYSLNQGWIEGALETSDKVIKMIKNSRQVKKSIKGGKFKKFSLKEVKQHKKKNDAWLVIDGMVLDVTKWIDNHPGGPIILNGLGKDATNMFNNSNHSTQAKKKLKKFQIGILE